MQRIDANKEEIELLQKKKADIEAEKKKIEEQKADEIKELNTFIE